MEDKGIRTEELKAALAGDLEQLYAEVATAMNNAKAGRMIADSEERVRDALQAGPPLLQDLARCR